MTTLAPSCRKRSAQALPMPRAAPVIAATLPESFMSDLQSLAANQSQEASGCKWRKRNLRRLAADELRHQTPGARRADQPDMAVAEGVDDVARGAGIADAGAAVRHARAMAHPHLDAGGRNVLRQFRK